MNNMIGRTKKKKVYLLSTLHRPVPLQHYLFYGDDMYPLLMDNKFNSNAISDAAKRDKEKAAVIPLLHTYIHTYIYTTSIIEAIPCVYLTYIHAYIHCPIKIALLTCVSLTYIHTYIHTYTALLK